MNTMKYKGYFAKVEFDHEDRLFIGHIIGIKDVVGFHGESVDELESAFKEAVDNYLGACKKSERLAYHPTLSKIKIKYDPIEDLSNEEWEN